MRRASLSGKSGSTPSGDAAIIDDEEDFTVEDAPKLRFMGGAWWVALLATKPMLVVMGIATVLALFGTDIWQLIDPPSENDVYMYSIVFIIMILFLVELLINAIGWRLD